MQPSKAASSLDSAIRREATSFEAEIAAFVSGVMPADLRTKFVETLRENRALRLAVGEFRSRCELTVEISERAHFLLDQVLDGLRQSSPLFPGDPYIAGLENRSDIAPQRERWLLRAIIAADRLIAHGELEDMALENRFRAEQNITNARRAQKDFGPSTSRSALEGALESLHREEWDGVSSRYPPYYLPTPPPDPAPLKFLAQNLSAPQHASRIASRLGELWGGEKGYYYETGLQAPSEDPETWAAVASAVNSSLALRRAIESFLKRPFTTPEPVKETFSKLVGARMLLQYAAQTNNEAAVAPVVTRLRSLIASAQKRPLTPHSHNLAEGLAYLLALEGDTSQTIWNAGTSVLVSHVRKGILGIPGHARVGRAADRTLVEALTRSENRLQSDATLQDTIVGCARGSDIPGRYTALRGIEELPLEHAIREVLYQIANSTDMRIKGRRDFSDEYPVNTVASHALYRLVSKHPDQARHLVIRGGDISAQLADCETLLDATERLYLAARNNPERKQWDSGAMTSLLTALFHLDAERALPRIKEHFTEGPRNHYGYYPFIYMLRDLNLRQFLPDLIQQLATARDIGRDGQRVILEVLESWGYRKRDIGTMLTEQAITRPIDSAFMDLVAEIDLPLSVDILRQALAKGLGQEAVWALILARNRSTQREIVPEHVRLLVGVLSDPSSQRMGVLERSYSLGDEAFETLTAWLGGPSKAMVSRELDSLFLELDEDPARSGEKETQWERVGALRTHRDNLTSTGQSEVKALDPPTAFRYLLTVVRPPPKILRHYLLSYSSKSDADLTPDQIAARRYCALALGENASTLHKFNTLAKWTNRMANIALREYTRGREHFADGDEYRSLSERPLRELTTAAIGLLSTEISCTTAVFGVLREEFERAHAAYARFNDDEIEAGYLRPLIGGLVRLEKLAEAKAYLEKFQIEELGPINGIIDIAVQTAKEQVIRGNAASALATMRFAEICVTYLPRSERKVAGELLAQELRGLF